MQPGYVGADCSTEEDEDEQKNTYLKRRRWRKNIGEEWFTTFRFYK
jgi:hypothetical protein